MFLGFGEVMARIATPGYRRWAQSVPGQVDVTWGGGEANIPLARTIIGGVIGATLLSLFVVPCLYLMVKRPKQVLPGT